ncbi:ABC transporter permease subunit [Novosphingobium terrae]|uniref:ABC transporter permease subunit n=1 Tax=Novosphingobium terrae TaxID=2726189 RepID=UPI0019825F0E|nr:ABC transporter permease subunit [Novosphingobium terrae]
MIALIQLEIRMLVTRRLNRAIGALLLLAMLIATASGLQQARSRQREIAHAQAETAQAKAQARAIAAQTNRPPEQYRDPSDPYGYLFYFARLHAIRALPPLALIATGDSDLLPTAMSIAPGHADARGVATVANPRLARIGRFDLAFVLAYLLPLALIAMAGTVISAEREGGQLPLLRAQPAGLGRIALARFSALAVVTIPAVLAMLWLTLALAGAVTGASSGMLAMLSLDLAGFMLFWLALAGCASGLRITGSASVIGLLLIWAVMGFVVPLACGWWAGLAAPSRIQPVQTSRDMAARFDADPAGQTSLWLKRHAPGLTPEASQRADLQRLALDGQTAEALAAYRLAAQDYDRDAALWQERLAPASPMLLLEQALLTAAGQDRRDGLRFTEQADQHALDLEARFTPAILASAQAKEAKADGGQAEQRYEAWSSDPVTHAALRIAPGWSLLLWALAAVLAAWALWQNPGRIADQGTRV